VPTVVVVFAVFAVAALAAKIDLLWQ